MSKLPRPEIVAEIVWKVDKSDPLDQRISVAIKATRDGVVWGWVGDEIATREPHPYLVIRDAFTSAVCAMLNDPHTVEFVEGK